RQTELRYRLVVIGNDAQHDADRAALLKDVGAETAQPRDAITNIDFRNLFKSLLLAVGHDRERHVQSFFGLQPRGILDRVELATDAHDRERTDLQVQVGRVMTTGNTQ